MSVKAVQKHQCGKIIRKKKRKWKEAGPIPETYFTVFGTACRLHTQVLMGQRDSSLQPLLEAELGPLPPVHSGLGRSHQERLAADEVGLLHGLLLRHKRDARCLVTRDSHRGKQNRRQWATTFLCRDESCHWYFLGRALLCALAERGL